jgi:hypothetical protein
MLGELGEEGRRSALQDGQGPRSHPKELVRDDRLPEDGRVLGFESQRLRQLRLRPTRVPDGSVRLPQKARADARLGFKATSPSASSRALS